MAKFTSIKLVDFVPIFLIFNLFQTIKPVNPLQKIPKFHLRLKGGCTLGPDLVLACTGFYQLCRNGHIGAGQWLNSTPFYVKNIFLARKLTTKCTSGPSVGFLNKYN